MIESFESNTLRLFNCYLCNYFLVIRIQIYVFSMTFALKLYIRRMGNCRNKILYIDGGHYAVFPLWKIHSKKQMFIWCKYYIVRTNTWIAIVWYNGSQ